MACWKNKPNCYTQTGFIDIPEGDHRVRIDRVTVEKTRNGSKCFEISFSHNTSLPALSAIILQLA